jgi:hypothetical protein
MAIPAPTAATITSHHASRALRPSTIAVNTANGVISRAVRLSREESYALVALSFIDTPKAA